MAETIDSLAKRVQQLETTVKGRGPRIEELERKALYLKGTLDAQNDLIQRMANAEKRLDDLSKRISNLASKG